ncbi:MAG: dipeptide transporter permease DppB [Methanosaeta sp. PtaU1.Bin060]|nr:MAG: dipeptide transporter permease DppB [Methanosaeta sp. PtaU1.Bin060]
MKLGASTSYILNKTLRYSITLFIVVTLNFFIPRMMPGDPIRRLLGENAFLADKQFLAELYAEYGLDKPLHVQYVNYLSSLASFDFGYSISLNQKVSELIADRMFWTAVLVMPSIILAALLGLALGSIAGYMRGKPIDSILTSINLFLYTCPSFLMAMTVITVFSFHLGWFPLGHATSGTQTGIFYLLDVAWHLFLPIMILSISGAVYKFLIIRNSIVEVMDEYFIFVARAKGLSDSRVAFVHVMRNILPQFISILALNFGFMVSGALIIETVFSLNGMGTMIYEAVSSRDYPVLQGAFLVLTISVLVANFLAEILYGIADPRIGDTEHSGKTG